MAEALRAHDASGGAVDPGRGVPGGSDGFYVDIEAGHPTEDSATHTLHLNGWRGVNVVSDPERLRLFAEFRADDVNVIASVGEPLARGEPNARDDGRHSVPRLTLSDVLDRYGPKDGRISFLRIAASGRAASMLGGVDWNRHRPEVIVLDGPGSDDEGDENGRSLPDLGYRLAFFDGRRWVFCRSGAAGVATPGRRTRTLRDAEARIEALGRDAEEARADLNDARSDLAEARLAGASARDALVRLQGEVAELRAIATAAETRSRVLSVNLTRAGEAAALAQRREEIVEARLAELEGLRHLASREPGPGRRSEEIDAMLAEHRREVFRHQAAHEELALWRESVKTSTSWRLTRPIRVAGRYLKRVYHVRSR